MTNNPLQQYFRQPKVFISLPSHGIYNELSDFNGPTENMPVFGMTSMDEILLKTPDALLTGESTVQVIQSCCPTIVNAWSVSNLDIDALLVAIKIATSGNTMHMVQICKKCDTENEYDVDVGRFLDHFASCKFNNKIVIGELTVKLKPLNYKRVTDFNIENFSLQKRLYQAVNLTDEDEKKTVMSTIYKDLGVLQTKIFLASIEQVETPSGIVSEYGFIKEWLENCDRDIFALLKDQVNSNNDTWRIPAVPVKCENCGTEDHITIDMDQSNFFGGA